MGSHFFAFLLASRGGHRRGHGAPEPLRMREPRGVPGTHIGGAGKSVAEPYPLGPVELAGGKEIQGNLPAARGILN